MASAIIPYPLGCFGVRVTEVITNKAVMVYCFVHTSVSCIMDEAKKKLDNPNYKAILVSSGKILSEKLSLGDYVFKGRSRMLYVKVPHEDSVVTIARGKISVDVSLEDPLNSLHQKAAAKLAIPPQGFVLTYNRQRLSDSGRKLKDYGLTRRAVVCVELVRSVLSVCLRPKSPLTLNVELSLTLGELKERISKKRGVTKEAQHLFLGLRELTGDSQSLSSLCLPSKASIDVVEKENPEDLVLTCHRGLSLYYFSVSPSKTVSEAKEKLRELYSFHPSEELELFQGEKKLEGCLNSCYIKTGKSLRLDLFIRLIIRDLGGRLAAVRFGREEKRERLREFICKQAGVKVETFLFKGDTGGETNPLESFYRDKNLIIELGDYFD